MDNAAILTELTEIFRVVFDDPALLVTPEFSRADQDRWDSMNHLNIIFLVEAKYGVRFLVSEVEEIHSVGDLIGVLTEKIDRR